MYFSTSRASSEPNVLLLKYARASTVPTAIALPGRGANASSMFVSLVGGFGGGLLSPQPIWVTRMESRTDSQAQRRNGRSVRGSLRLIGARAYRRTASASRNLGAAQ